MNAGRGLGQAKVSISDGKKLLAIQMRDENFGLAGRILNFIAGNHPLEGIEAVHPEQHYT